MNALNTRFKQVRLALHKNQSEFAELLGFAQTGISMIELGKRNVSDRHIKTICSVCNINEDWLRTGAGGEDNMFIQTDSALLDDLATEYNMSEKQKKIIATFAAMDEKKREVLAEAFFEFVDALASSPDVSATIATRPVAAVRPAASDNNATREDVHRLIDQEFDAKEKGQTLSASTTTNGLGEKLA